MFFNLDASGFGLPPAGPALKPIFKFDEEAV